LSFVREKIQDYIRLAGHVVPDRELAAEILSLIDLTSLGESDTPEIIEALCKKAVTPAGQVAALCIYPQFVRQVSTLAPTVKIATVVNFPAGRDEIDSVVNAIKQAIQAGAAEIDVVFPYERYLAGDRMGAQAFIRQCRTACTDEITLKVILETGAISDLDMLSEISQDVILAGADFLKTSTGKIGTGATLEAAAVMLLAIKGLQPNIKRKIGFKASGGVRSLEDAAQYVELARQIMGREWVGPATFRLGASQLLDVLLNTL
jgi:deoxyribose-phosphate aldolase